MTDLIKELREQISELTRQRDAAGEKLAMLERSIADLSHPNMRLLLAAWDAEKAARRALAEAGQEVMKFLDAAPSPDMPPNPALAVAMLGSALELAAKLP